MQKIKKLENVYKIYQKQLLEEGTVKQEDLKQLQDHVSGIMSSEFEEARTYKPEVSAGLHFPDLACWVSGHSARPFFWQEQWPPLPVACPEQSIEGNELIIAKGAYPCCWHNFCCDTCKPKKVPWPV